MRRTVVHAVKVTKNDWFQKKARDVGAKVLKVIASGDWKDIRDSK